MDENHIFLLDDNPAHRTLVKRALQKASISLPIVEAASLQEARKLLLSNSSSTPAVAIFDLNLSDGKSTALMRELRQLKQFAPLPILVLSTSALERDVEECYASGANCFLTKADDMSTLAQEIGAGVNFLLSVSLLPK